jgi:serine protease AprX
VTYTGANTYTATHVDGLMLTGADGLMLTGADGLMLTGADGTSYQVNSVVIRQPDGLMLTGADGLMLTGADGLMLTGADGLMLTGADGLMLTGADSVRIDNASKAIARKTDGTVFYAPLQGLMLTGADTIAMTGVNGVTMNGVQGLMLTGADGLMLTGADASGGGLVSFDPELLKKLEQATDDSGLNAVVIYHQPVTDTDIAELQAIGIRGGTRFRALPMVVISGTPEQIFQISRLRTVRYVSGHRTLEWSADDSRTLTGLRRVSSDADITGHNHGMPVGGNGVNVAVIDTGIDSTHADLSGRVLRNIKLADLQGMSPVGFNYPVNVENLSSTDMANGHGTFVGGIIAGSGARSSGKYKGFAPKSRLIGLSAGDASLFSVLAGFDYLLAHPDLSVRVVNCSFSSNTRYQEDDPVNVATKMLVQRGVNVVFSAGNTGPGLYTLNPYAQAPWVISVGAVDNSGKLANFSSRGAFGSRTNRPTLVAPGVSIVSLRAANTNLNGIEGGAALTDAQQLSLTEAPYYTTSSGTSFSAPMVAGTIALMLEANPNLTPAQVRDILQRTATPLPPYYQHEVGAGLLNTHAAVLEASFPQRRMGLFRAVLNRRQLSFVQEEAKIFKGTVAPGSPSELYMNVPADAVMASTQIAWGPLWSPNDLALSVYDSTNSPQGSSNTLNLPVLTGRRERTLTRMPKAGQWRVRVVNALGPVGTPQDYDGVFEIARVQYAPLRDLGTLDEQKAEAVRVALRTLTMWPHGSYFRPSFAVTRADLAGAMVAGGRTPQYMPARSNFTDISDRATMNFVESAQADPDGALFPDAQRGGAFRPDDAVTRLIAAVVLVRAAGLESEAQANMTTQVNFIDAASIPAQYRGHVYVAIHRGLISRSESFEPNAAFTRADLAQALSTLSRIYVP